MMTPHDANGDDACRKNIRSYSIQTYNITKNTKMVMMQTRKLFEPTAGSIWSGVSLGRGKSVTDSPDSQSSVGPHSFPHQVFLPKSSCPPTHPTRFCKAFTFCTKFLVPDSADWGKLSIINFLGKVASSWPNPIIVGHSTFTQHWTTKIVLVSKQV